MNEKDQLKALQFNFAIKQHERMLDTKAEGKKGWQKLSRELKYKLIRRLGERANSTDVLDRYNLIDIANICMILLHDVDKQRMSKRR